MTTLLETPGRRATVSPNQIPGEPPRRILVVEDDVEIRQLNARILVRSGYQVAAAGDGAAGWEALRASTFDLLTTDHDMPKLSGLELVRKARAARMALPVILASGSWHTEELGRHPWLQLAAILLKPFSPHELLETVEGVLQNADRCGSTARTATAPAPRDNSRLG